MLFINDLPSIASNCTAALFPDDSKCFREINDFNDCILLQNDLNRMFEWSQSWNMNFNLMKCKVLTITRGYQKLCFNYSLDGASLEHVGTFTDLGVVVDEKLSFNSHIEQLITKCNKMCGFIKRSIGFTTPTHVSNFACIK